MSNEKSYDWKAMLLISVYIGCQLTADVGATKLVLLAPGLVVAGGGLIYALTFTVRDMMQRRIGKISTQQVIVGAAVANGLMALYLLLISVLPAPVFYQWPKEWTLIMAFLPSITIASIVAEMVSELLDTEVFTRLLDKGLLRAVGVSNAISVVVDTLIFTLLAFVVLPPLFGGDGISFASGMSMMPGQILWKMAMALLGVPLVWVTRKVFK